mmetsp:Transcript_3321/g.11125  ORF Transcript_3321/g.11125 Transcript_3321/m.11125 type:complete len:258 (-) Transcript_3321:279-1052(-)
MQGLHHGEKRIRVEDDGRGVGHADVLRARARREGGARGGRADGVGDEEGAQGRGVEGDERRRAQGAGDLRRRGDEDAAGEAVAARGRRERWVSVRRVSVREGRDLVRARRSGIHAQETRRRLRGDARVHRPPRGHGGNLRRAKTLLGLPQLALKTEERPPPANRPGRPRRRLHHAHPIRQGAQAAGLQGREHPIDRARDVDVHRRQRRPGRRERRRATARLRRGREEPPTRDAAVRGRRGRSVFAQVAQSRRRREGG